MPLKPHIHNNWRARRRFLESKFEDASHAQRAYLCAKGLHRVAEGVSTPDVLLRARPAQPLVHEKATHGPLARTALSTMQMC